MDFRISKILKLENLEKDMVDLDLRYPEEITDITIKPVSDEKCEVIDAIKSEGGSKAQENMVLDHNSKTIEPEINIFENNDKPEMAYKSIKEELFRGLSALEEEHIADEHEAKIDIDESKPKKDILEQEIETYSPQKDDQLYTETVQLESKKIIEQDLDLKNQVVPNIVSKVKQTDEHKSNIIPKIEKTEPVSTEENKIKLEVDNKIPDKKPIFDANKAQMHFLDPSMGTFVPKVKFSPRKVSSVAEINTKQKDSLEKTTDNKTKGNLKKVKVERVDQDDFHNHEIVRKLDHIYRKILLRFRDLWYQVANGGEIDRDTYFYIAKQLSTASVILEPAPELITSVIVRPERPEDYNISHSVSVAMMSLSMGHIEGYSFEMILKLGICALFSDIGMALVDENLYNHDQPLTQFQRENIEKHPELGYALLHNTPFMCKDAAEVALESHENIDGSGYPYGKRDDEIRYFSKLVHMVDRYDAMIQPRPYREPIAQHAALMRLVQERNRLDQKCVKILISSLTFYPVGSIIKLDSNELAIVRHGNRKAPTRPKIEIFVSSEGKRMVKTKLVDLSKSDFYEIRQTMTPLEAEKYIKARAK